MRSDFALRIGGSMRLKQALFGMVSFVPGINRLGAKGTGGTDSARYCYSVWLRHLIMAKKNGLNPYPKVVAELGPGDSLGIGLAALISGSDKYFAFDVVEHANAKRNAAIFAELVTLFGSRTPVPGDDEFPNAKPYLEDYAFPADIFDDNRLRHALEEARTERIRGFLSTCHDHDSPIQYKVPWYGASILAKESVDMIYSQAVLEHVDDVRDTYRAMHSWLRPTGYMSHQIDFKSHGTAEEWNGHWVYSDLMWTLIRGKRPYLLNRAPHSTHIATLIEEGFRVVCDKTIHSESRVTRDELAPRFRFMSDEDLITSGAFIQGVKSAESNA